MTFPDPITRELDRLLDGIPDGRWIDLPGSLPPTPAEVAAIDQALAALHDEATQV